MTHAIRLIREPGPDWSRYEAQLRAAGTPLPLIHQSAWVADTGDSRWLLVALDDDDRCRGAIGVQVRPSRAMPGHRSLRADEVGLVGEVGTVARLLAQLHRVATEEPGVLRLDVALTCADRERRHALASSLRSAGFTPSRDPESYRYTSLIDLSPDQDALMAGLHRTARRHIRAVDRRPVRLRRLDDEKWADPMAELLEETYRRTGASPPDRPLRTMLGLARQHPEAVHVVGLFAEDDGAMLSFACGHREGPRVRYAEAGSTRRDDLKVPLGYAPMWELIVWAKREGAAYFDLGGITAGRVDDDDPLGGISDFKRYFQGTITEVGEEWSRELLPARAQWVRFVHQVATWTRRNVQQPLRQGASLADLRDSVVEALSPS